MKNKPLIYIAGPLTGGDVDKKIEDAMKVATILLSKGFHVVVPHLNMYIERYWDREGVFGPHWSYDKWMELDYAILVKCDAMFKMQGDSAGADREEAFAFGAGIPVFNAVYDIEIWLEEWKNKDE